jgi:hypothetical protein
MFNLFLRSAILSMLLTACSGKPESFSQSKENHSSPSQATVEALISDSSVARSMLDSLRIIAPRVRDNGFDTSSVPKVAASSLLALVSDSGLVFHDVNQTDTTIRFTRAALGRAIDKREGNAFVSLAHLAYRYSEGQGSDARLRFTPTASGVDVDVGRSYHVGFIRQREGLRIARISYTELEG